MSKHKRDQAIPLQAILELVTYLEHDEWKHYEEMLDAGDDTSDHIFNHVKVISDWLETRGMGTAIGRERERMAWLDEAFADAGVKVVQSD
jgi:hypothetical protein